MIDIIVSLIIVAILSLAIYSIYKSHKKGIKCIGCLDSKTCALKAANLNKALDEYRKDQKCSK